MPPSNNQVVKALLITKGRKTSKDHAVWLRAVMYNDKIYFSRHNQDADWFKNSLKNPNVRVVIGKKSSMGMAKFVKNQNLSKLISELKYPGESRAKDKRVVLEVTF